MHTAYPALSEPLGAVRSTRNHSLLGRASSVLLKHLEAARCSEPALWAAGRWVCLPAEGRLLVTSCRLLWQHQPVPAPTWSWCMALHGGGQQAVGGCRVGTAVLLPASSLWGRASRTACFPGLLPAHAQRFPACPDPSFCWAVGSSAKPRGISLELSKQGLGKQGRFPCRSAARAVLMSLFRFGGGSLGRDVVDGGRGRSLSIAAPLAAFPESAGTQAWSAFPVPACPQPLRLACVKGLACAQYLGYYL